MLSDGRAHVVLEEPTCGAAVVQEGVPSAQAPQGAGVHDVLGRGALDDLVTEAAHVVHQAIGVGLDRDTRESALRGDLRHETRRVVASAASHTSIQLPSMPT